MDLYRYQVRYENYNHLLFTLSLLPRLNYTTNISFSQLSLCKLKCHPFLRNLHSKPSANSKLQSPLSPFSLSFDLITLPTLLLFTTINKRPARECSQQRFASIDLCDRNDARTSPRAFSPIYLCPSRDHATEESPPGLLSRFATVGTLFLFPVPFVAAILASSTFLG